MFSNHHLNHAHKKSVIPTANSLFYHFLFSQRRNYAQDGSFPQHHDIVVDASSSKSYLANVSKNDQILLICEIERVFRITSAYLHLPLSFYPCRRHPPALCLYQLLNSASNVNVVNAMNPAKRRRLDADASTLRKPFRSPLKVPLDTQISASRQPRTPNNLDQQEHHSSPSLTSSSVSDFQVKKSHRHSNPRAPAAAIEVRSTDEITILQKRYSALTQDLRRLRQDLDVTEQARKLCSSNERKQVEHLLLKWRDIARSVADQVFDISNNRVKEMGGIEAWQKSTLQSSQDWLDQRMVVQNDYQYHEDRVVINGESTEHENNANTEESEESNAHQEVRSGHHVLSINLLLTQISTLSL